MKTVLVVGATGDVGKGIVASLLSAGHTVVAAARSQDKLQQLRDRHPREAGLLAVPGSVQDTNAAITLRDAVLAAARELDAVVVAVGSEMTGRPVFDRNTSETLDFLNANLLPHYAAASVFIPALAKGGLYLSIGGGMADFVVTGYSQASMVQAAQRMLFRHIAAEMRDADVHVRELIVASMVNGDRTRAIAGPKWVTDLDVGDHVRAILDNPEEFPGPILTLKSRGQVGQPEPPERAAS